MKKIILSIFLVLTLFMITGCRKKNEINNNNENKLIISDYDLTLNKESSFSKIKFKYPDKAIISNPITSMIIDYKKEGSDENLFRIVMGDMYGTNIDDSMEGFNKEGTLVINDIEWTVYSKDGKKHYGINIDYSNIVISFIYEDSNLSKFEQKFMENITLNK